MRRNNKPVAIISLMAISTVMFIYHQFLGGNVMNQAITAPSDPNFNPINIIMHMFTHSGVVHFVLNMLVLLSFGAIEGKIGSRNVVILYVFAGIVAYVFQISLGHGSSPMMGASGSVMGMIGATTIFNPKEKIYIIFFPLRSFELWRVVAVLMVVETVIGLNFSTGIGHMAHVGGGLAGMAFVLIAYKTQRRYMKNRIRGYKLGRYLFGDK